MKKINKKAFTLVELLVVIAILAVLATVAIIGYGSFIEESKVSNDNTVVTELNRFTEAYIAGGGEVNTVQDVAEELKKDGFLISTLKPSATKDYYAFNIKTKKFMVITENDPELPNTAQGKADIFVLVGNEKAFAFASPTEGDHYSMYLQTSYAFDSTLDIKAGLDVGEVDNINTINYDRSIATDGIEAVIRTNTGVLNINGPKDALKHYGQGQVLNIEAIYTSSYHEFGTFSNGQIKTGHIVIENSDAKIDNLLLIAKNETSFDTIIVETKQGAEFPVFDRTDVEISSTGTLVVNVKTPSTDDYIYLTKAGVIEQVVVTSEETNDVSSQSGNVSTKSATTQLVAQEIANIGKKNDQGQYVDEEDNIIDVNNLTKDNVVIEEPKAAINDAEKTTGEEKVFAGGVGTEKSPYIISNLNEWNNLAKDSKTSKVFSKSGKYYNVVSDITFDESLEIISDFAGHIDFKNHTITVLNNISDSNIIDYVYNNSSFENLNIFTYRNNFSIVAIGYENITFKNINISGSYFVTGNNYGSFIEYPGLYGDYDVNLTFENCNVYSNITATSDYSGVFIGTFNYMPKYHEANVIMKNCSFQGTLSSGKYAAMVISSPASGWTSDVWNSADVNMYFENVRNEGIIRGSLGAGLIMSNAGAGGYYEYVEGGKTRGKVYFYSDESLENEYLITDEDENRIKLNGDSTPSVLDIKNSTNGITTRLAFESITIDENKLMNFGNIITNDATKYVVSFGFYGVWGSFNGGAFAYNIEINSNNINNTQVYAYEWVNANTYGDEKALPAPGLNTHIIEYSNISLTVDSENHYVFVESGGMIRRQPKITVFALDDDNKVINIATYDYPTN